jgi:2-polyprenyl-3-methyl-5-hydroxy-6-metoxy-1,4-benzoquinol methylase
MNEKIICPLCNENNAAVVERIKTNELVVLWKRRNVDTSKLFQNEDVLEKLACNNCGLKYFNPFISGDNDFYSKLGEEEWYYLHEDKTEFEYSNKYIKEGDSVLDVGSGRGAFLKYIDKKIKYTGLELSSRAIEYAKKDNINVIENTIEDYAINNKKSHDVVVTFQVLEHIANIDSFLEAMVNVVKPNGIIIIAVPNNESFIKDCQNHLLNLPPHHLLHWNEKSLKYIAYKYNLEIVNIYKEKLTNIHRKWHDAIVLSKIIHDILGMEIKTINMSITSNIINKISSLIVRVFRLKSVDTQKHGMTIAIALRKIKNA